MFVICIGGQAAAKDRLAAAGWRVGALGINGVAFEAASKNGAVVVFEPGYGDDGYASLPGGMGMGFLPLPRGNPLYEEAMDCLSDVHRGS